MGFFGVGLHVHTAIVESASILRSDVKRVGQLYRFPSSKSNLVGGSWFPLGDFWPKREHIQASRQLGTQCYICVCLDFVWIKCLDLV